MPGTHTKKLRASRAQIASYIHSLSERHAPAAPAALPATATAK